MRRYLINLMFVTLSTICFWSCSQEPYDWSTQITLKVITGDCVEVKSNYAKVNIEIIDDSGESRIGGICYSENENPSIENNDRYIQYDVLKGKEEIYIDGLESNTKYFYRAFIFGDSFEDIIYGETKTFTTKEDVYRTEGMFQVGNAAYTIRPGRIAWYSHCYSSTATIPETVVIDNLTYKVNGVSGMVGIEGLTSINIPNTIDTIADGAFYSCTKLSNVNIPSTIKYIGDSFVNTPWKKAIIGDKYIGNIMFYHGGSTGDTSIEIKEGTTLVSPGAFYTYRTYTELTLPSSLIEIGESAFVRAENLTKITIKSKTPPIVKIGNEGDDNFGYTNKETCILCVPSNNIDEYKKDSFWSQFKNIQGIEI